MALPPGLGPWCTGVRVVVRRVLPGTTGPTGGPALTDVLGVLEEWGEDTLTVRREDGTAVVVERRLVVSGKPVPPRPSVRMRLDADEVALRAAATWPAVDTDHVGDWLLRSSAGFSLRASSALLAGDPGRSWDDALAAVRAFYDDRREPVVVQALIGSDAARLLEDSRWVPAREGLEQVVVQLAGVAQSLRAVRRAGGPDTEEPVVSLTDHVTDEWLASDRRALDHRAAATAVLEGPERVTFASLTFGNGRVVAKGRAALSDRAADWVGLSDLWVDPAWRRRRLGHAVLESLLGWAAERGATTASLQASGDNRAALALYERLGFVTHHGYRYLTPPPA